MRRQPFSDQIVYGHPRIQRGIRILKNYLHFFPQRMHRIACRRAHINAVYENLSLRCRRKTENRTARRGFPAAGFSHKPEDFPLLYGKADIVHSLDISQGMLDKPALYREIFFQIPYIYHVIHAVLPSAKPFYSQPPQYFQQNTLCSSESSAASGNSFSHFFPAYLHLG